jgi:hypothetical protein
MCDYSRFSQTWDCGFELFDKGIYFSVCLIYGPLYTVSILLSQPVKAASTTTILASEEKVFAALSFVRQQATQIWTLSLWTLFQRYKVQKSFLVSSVN